MDLVFVVPGIMGSELFLGEERLWPPPLLRNVEDPERLLDPDVVTGDIIREVLVLPFYKRLLDPLAQWGYPEKGRLQRGRCIPWPYNWIRGVPENARKLAQSIREELNGHDGDQVVLLAHSMGGLICTYALECLVEEDVLWRERVRLLVTFGTPFLGAPTAVLNAFGMEGVMGIKAGDCQELMARPEFQSAYQLLPHLHTLSSWESWSPLSPIHDYQDIAPQGPQLGIENLFAALDLQDALRNARPNPATRKFNFCGTSYKTVWGVERAADPQEGIGFRRSKAGDGTVPSWSGRQHASVQFAPLGDKHNVTFGSKDLLSTLLLLLRGVAPPIGPRGRPPAPPRPLPDMQPRVSVTHNAISSRRASVEVEVSEPPVDGVLNLAWVHSAELETLEQLAERVGISPAELSADLSLQLGAELDYPLTLTLAPPPMIGTSVLMAWAGTKPVRIMDLDADRMDVVWRFVDEDEDKDEPAQFAHEETAVSAEAEQMHLHAE